MAVRQEQQPASDEIVEVAPDILRMQLPISLPGLGHVNTYALCDDRGLAVVDPGLPGKASWDALVSRLGAAGYGVKDVHTVIVTHSHPDHFGGAGILRHEAGADVLTHEAFRTWLDPDEGDDAGPDELPDGVEAEGPTTTSRQPWNVEQPWGGGKFKPPMKRRLGFKASRLIGKKWMRAPEPNRRVVDDEVVTFAGREWVAIHTPGHTNDHLCLYSPTDGVFLAGDHVLPTITPHISGLIAGADPLAQFFSSLDRVAALDDVTLALPAHGLPFPDLPGRCQEIKDHHADRLDTLRDAATALGEASVVALSHELFRQRSWGRMAESETYAHLEHLRHGGEMISRRVGDDLHYSLVPEPTPRRHHGLTGQRRRENSAPAADLSRRTRLAVDDDPQIESVRRVEHPNRGTGVDLDGARVLDRDPQRSPEVGPLGEGLLDRLPGHRVVDMAHDVEVAEAQREVVRLEIVGRSIVLQTGPDGTTSRPLRRSARRTPRAAGRGGRLGRGGPRARRRRPARLGRRRCGPGARPIVRRCQSTTSWPRRCRGTRGTRGCPSRPGAPPRARRGRSRRRWCPRR